VLQCGVVCCSVLQRVAVRCGVLQCAGTDIGGSPYVLLQHKGGGGSMVLLLLMNNARFDVVVLCGLWQCVAVG